MSTVHDFTAMTPEGREKPLSDFSGQVLLVVNTASDRGFARQYEGLEAPFHLAAREPQIVDTLG